MSFYLNFVKSALNKNSLVLDIVGKIWRGAFFYKLTIQYKKSTWDQYVWPDPSAL